MLTPQAVEKLFETLRKLAATGCSILYISHKLDEIRALCHQCTVLRGGRVVASCDPTQESTASLSRMMIGAEPPRLERRPAKVGALALSARGSPSCHDRFGVALEDVSLDVHAGEIVGMAGVSGNGQQELLASLSGEDPRADAGAIHLFGQPIGRMGAAARRKRGLHFVPEERLGRGAVPSLSLANNMLLTRNEALRALGWIDRAALRQQASGVIRRYWVKASGPAAAARSLSGGNPPEVHRRPGARRRAKGAHRGAADLGRRRRRGGADPRRAPRAPRRRLRRARRLGGARGALRDQRRLHVIAKGRLSPSMATADATVERIGEWMSGLRPGGPGQAATRAGGLS